MDSILIYCDGACSGNPGPGGWGSIILIPSGQVFELGGYSPRTTNNQMEITASIRALESVEKNPEPVTLFTDSQYLIRGITQWIWAWRKKDWKTADGKSVMNRELWEELARVTARRTTERKITWNYVAGHSGNPGNDRVDEIAVGFSKHSPVSLYRGPLEGYGISIAELPAIDNEALKRKLGATQKGQAFSYLSMIGNTVNRHTSWAECERRVKGQARARFKKAMSESDEAKILEDWGVSLSLLPKKG